MQITNINQQQKRMDRYSIFIDGKYTFSLGESELINSGLKIGQEISKEELEKLKDTARLDKAYDSALNLIARRPRSKWELTQYLKRKNYDQTETDSIINKLSERNYADDISFAKTWVNNRRLLKPTSRKKLMLELRQKGVSSEIISQVLEEDETLDMDTLKELINKKRRQTKYQDDLKLMQFLARQGFNYGDIKQALSNKDLP